MNMAAFEAEMTRITFWYAVSQILAFVFFMWVLYLVIKAAVRDGIQEAGMTPSWERTVDRAKQHRDSHFPDAQGD